MTMVKTLIVGAAIGAVLAVAAIAAAVPLLKTSAGEVATRMATETSAGEAEGSAGTNPLEPPNFYGSR